MCLRLTWVNVWGLCGQLLQDQFNFLWNQPLWDEQSDSYKISLQNWWKDITLIQLKSSIRCLIAPRYSLRDMSPALKQSKRVCILFSFSFICMVSLWPSCSSRPEALNLGFGHCLLSLACTNCSKSWLQELSWFVRVDHVGVDLMKIDLVYTHLANFLVFLYCLYLSTHKQWISGCRHQASSSSSHLTVL